METFLLSGCGVSLVCRKGATMTHWIDYIIFELHGVPVVTRITSGDAR